MTGRRVLRGPQDLRRRGDAFAPRHHRRGRTTGRRLLTRLRVLGARRDRGSAS